MFSNLLSDAIPSEDQFWLQQPFSVRLAAMHRGEPRVAWLCDEPNTSSFRYRCWNPSATLEAVHPEIGAAWFSLTEMPEVLRSIRHLDTLIIHRMKYSGLAAEVITQSRAHGAQILFDCDDFVFDSKRVHQILDALDQPDDGEITWDFWHAYIGRIEATARLCDAGICTNEYLGKFMSEVIGCSSVVTLPNFLARKQEEASRRLLDAKRKRKFQGDGSIAIGYFSGTPTHNRDFAIAAPAISRILRSDSRVHLRVVGFPPSHECFRALGDRIEVIPLQDYLNLQRVIAECEIGVAPLQENEFTNCKSELKFFEAAIVGTWTVASPAYTFKNAIVDGRNGRLAFAHQWDDALKEAVDLVRDSRRYAAIAEDAAEYCYQRYGWARHSDTVLQAAGISSTHDNLL